MQQFAMSLGLGVGLVMMSVCIACTGVVYSHALYLTVDTQFVQSWIIHVPHS